MTVSDGQICSLVQNIYSTSLYIFLHRRYIGWTCTNRIHIGPFYIGPCRSCTWGWNDGLRCREGTARFSTDHHLIEQRHWPLLPFFLFLLDSGEFPDQILECNLALGRPMSVPLMPCIRDHGGYLRIFYKIMMLGLSGQVICTLNSSLAGKYKMKN